MNTIAPFKITVCGIEELAGHCDANVSHALSILDPEWPVPEAFGAFGEHAKLELRFHDVIDEYDADMIAPQQEHVAELLSLRPRIVGRAASRRAPAHPLSRWCFPIHCLDGADPCPGSAGRGGQSHL